MMTPRIACAALSLMPEGLLDALTEAQAIDLIACLMIAAPSPSPK